MYLDTSALGALYIPEALSAAAAAALGTASPAISALTEAEFAAVVARRLRERTLSPADGAKVLLAFDTHLSEHRYRRLPVATQTFADAVTLLRSGTVALSTLDALHLAVVTSHREALCTADRQLARAAVRLNVKVHLVHA